LGRVGDGGNPALNRNGVDEANRSGATAQLVDDGTAHMTDPGDDATDPLT